MLIINPHPSSHSSSSSTSIQHTNRRRTPTTAARASPGWRRARAQPAWMLQRCSPAAAHNNQLQPSSSPPPSTLTTRAGSSTTTAAAVLRRVVLGGHQRRSVACSATSSMQAGGGDAAAAPEVQMAAAFKSPAAQAAFDASFKLNAGAGVQLTVLQHQQQQQGGVHAWWGSAAFFRHLRASTMGHVLLSTPSIPSTQEFMRAHTHVLPKGAVLVADQQTRGKGRGGNVWTSPPGCLMFSAFRQLQVSGAAAPFINYVVCLAVARGIKEATAHLLPGGLDVQIKWPNDIYCGGLKVGGALIHTTWAAASQQFGVLTGVGLNVSNSQPTTCLDDIVVAAAAAAGGSSGQQPAAAAAGGQQLRVCKEQLLAAVLTHLEACFDQFEALGFEPLRQPYLDAWLHSNQVVQVADDVAVVAGGPQQQAQGGLSLRIVGLSPAGFLLATDGAGQEWELTPDGNSLDMMQGLLKKKL